jgi:aminoglycoside 6-adenylyltransferase
MKDASQEDEILNRLTQWAEEQALVRAMLLTSSRASKNAPVDMLSDYDVLLYVSDTRPFADSDTWLQDFGKFLVQFRDERDNSYGIHEYARLVLYEDGTKIDFTIAPVDTLRKIREEPALPDSLDIGYRVLVDKERLAKELKPPTYMAHVPSRPTEEEFRSLVEEFWWETTYVARNLWRDDLFGAKYSLDYVIKFDLLRRMLEWYVEIDHNWSLKPGNVGRGLKKFLEPEIWSEVESAFAGASIKENWRALFKTTDLFRKIANSVAADLGYEYLCELDDRVMKYLLKIRGLENRGPGE